MGYLTDFYIRVSGDDQEKVRKWVDDHYACEETPYWFEYGHCPVVGFEAQTMAYQCKWYDHDIDFSDYSKENPDLTFDVFGMGEDTGDLWMKRYKDGEMVLFESLALQIPDSFVLDTQHE